MIINAPSLQYVVLQGILPLERMFELLQLKLVLLLFGESYTA